MKYHAEGIGSPLVMKRELGWLVRELGWLVFDFGGGPGFGIIN